MKTILILIALLLSGNATAGYPWDGDWTWRLQTGASSYHAAHEYERLRKCSNYSFQGNETTGTCREWMSGRGIERGRRLEWNERNAGIGIEGYRQIPDLPGHYVAASAGLIEDSYGDLGVYGAAGFQWTLARYHRLEARATLMTVLHYRTVRGVGYDSCGTTGGSRDAAGNYTVPVRCETPRHERELIIYPYPALTLLDHQGLGLHLTYAPKKVAGVETWIVQMTYAL